MPVNEVLINVPGRLHSVAAEHHLGGANEIYDDDLARLQSDINSEALTNVIPILYDDLVELRDNNGLIPGKMYRITDYVTTTSQEYTRSAGHPFDIIVTADDESHLNEVARAILHSGDTYFASCKLESWELKYCLDNDTNRFTWADTTNGKGVVYYMKDERNNECPYDFKNIQFKRWTMIGRSGLIMDAAAVDDNTYSALQVARMRVISSNFGETENKENYAPFRGYIGEDPILGSELTGSYVGYDLSVATIDAEAYYITAFCNGQNDRIYCKVSGYDYYYTFDLKGNNGGSDLSLTDNSIFNNTIKQYVNEINNKQELNNIVFLVYELSTDYYIYNNVFEEGCYNNTFGQRIYKNTFDINFFNNVFSYYVVDFVAKNDNRYNIFYYSCRNSYVPKVFVGNVIGNTSYCLQIGPNALHNVIGNNLNSFISTGAIQKSVFGDSARYLMFDFNTLSVYFGDDIQFTRFIGINQYIIYGDDIKNLKGHMRECQFNNITHANIKPTVTLSSSQRIKRCYFNYLLQDDDAHRALIEINEVEKTTPTIYQPTNTEIININV